MAAWDDAHGYGALAVADGHVANNAAGARYDSVVDGDAADAFCSGLHGRPRS